MESATCTLRSQLAFSYTGPWSGLLEATCNDSSSSTGPTNGDIFNSAVIVLCRDESAARKRFGSSAVGVELSSPEPGDLSFNDVALANTVLARLGDAVEKDNLWSKLETSWLCIDAELPIPSAPFDDLDLEKREDEEEWDRRVMALAAGFIAVTKRSCAPEQRCAYRCVLCSELWPSWACTALIDSPPVTARLATECRPSL